MLNVIDLYLNVLVMILEKKKNNTHLFCRHHRSLHVETQETAAQTTGRVVSGWLEQSLYCFIDYFLVLIQARPGNYISW